MRTLALLAALSATVTAAENPAATLWNELKTKRDALPALHQEFDVTQTIRRASGDSSVRRQIVLDISGSKWRERTITGGGGKVRIFDGNQLLATRDVLDEVTRTPHKAKDPGPIPRPYIDDTTADISKAVEVQRRSCGFDGLDHDCVLLEVPLKGWMRGSPRSSVSMLKGTARALFDTETGMLVSLGTVEGMRDRSSQYVSETWYGLKRMTRPAQLDAALFQVAASMHEVKTFTTWDAKQIQQHLKGKPAPEFVVTDLQGKPVSLPALRGKLVLLDFWATWCPPCRADAPALDKLYTKYDRDLMIVAFSVGEDRAPVEQFLRDHPHAFPVALTAGNELPAEYEVAALPTYIVIGRDGALVAAVQGDQGFKELAKLLKKAGLEVD